MKSFLVTSLCTRKYLVTYTNASFIAGEVTDGEIVNSDVLEKISNNLSHKIDDLSAKSRTAKLWIQYIKYINIVKLVIAAERTGNWHNHLTTVTKMLNLFAKIICHSR